MNSDIVEKIKNGAVGVLPTDTIYGLVCSPWHKAAVERMYVLKKRDLNKPLVMIISQIEAIEQFGIKLSSELRQQLEKYWPGPVSIILECENEKLAYLHRGTKSLAFRLPDDEGLRTVLAETGPLYTTSVNREGEPPATTVMEGKACFGDSVDFYVDGGILANEPSTVIKFNNGVASVIRQGKAKL